MKKTSKLLALLLALLMVLSLFTACGDEKKDDDKKDEETSAAADEKDNEKEDEKEEEKEDVKTEEKISAEDMLIGDWETKYESDGFSFAITFTFKSNGTIEVAFTEDNYNALIDQMVEMAMAEVTEEDLAAEGIESMEEAEELFREMFLEDEEFSYEIMSADIEMSGEWELDGDTLTITNENGGTMTAETKLSEGETSFALINADGEEIELAKVN